MNAINSETFEQICDGVWRDRATVLQGHGEGSGDQSGEVALLRAVYWRLCKAGGESGQSINDYDADNLLLAYQRLVTNTLAQFASPPFDGTPYLEELLSRYREEVAKQ
jgi:hypothetical protein